MLRYLNMFVLIGLALVGISIAGFVTHNRFLMEPGQPVNAWASLIYLGAGILMLVNGYVSIQHGLHPATEAEQKKGHEKESDSAGTREHAETTVRS
jgi:hypothetical protein